MGGWKLFADEIGSPSPYPGRTVLGKAPVLLASVDRGGNLRYISISWKAILGFVPEWETTRPIQELIVSEREATERVVAALLDADTSTIVEFGLRCPDGIVRRYQWYRRYDPEERLMYLVGEEADPGSGPGRGGKPEPTSK